MDAYRSWLSWQKRGKSWCELTDAKMEEARYNGWIWSGGFGQMRDVDSGIWAKHSKGAWRKLATRSGKIVSKWWQVIREVK